MLSKILITNMVVVPISFGVGALVAGQYFLGIITIVLGFIFSVRELHKLLGESQLVLPRRIEIFVAALAFYSQQMLSVFFACMFWMVQGDFRLITAKHWITGFETALTGASVLSLLAVSRLGFLFKGKARSFFVSSIVVSLIDRFIHPSHFGGPYAEALVTGVSAAGTNMFIDFLFEILSKLPVL